MCALQNPEFFISISNLLQMSVNSSIMGSRKIFFLFFSLIFIQKSSRFIDGHPLDEYIPDEDNDNNIYNEVEQLLSLGRTIREGQEQEDITNKYNNNKPAVPKAVKNWPLENLQLGQVSAVGINSANQPVIFHRADRIWNQSTFNRTNYFQQAHLGPINEYTVLTLHPNNGTICKKWGANLFFMPHGLTVDRHDNFWITDVGMHQAFKFKPGELQPTLVFGELFHPGSDNQHLCKPTSFAIANTGEIFLADGYCNNRILKFNAAGVLLKVIPSPSEFLSLLVPHSLALMENLDRLCIADRENMRVVCPRAGLNVIKEKKELPLTIQQPDMGRLFAVAAKGNLIYAVNGFTNEMIPVQGLTIDPESETVIDHWSPEEGFNNPHDIAISANDSSMYVAEIGPNKIWKFELVSGRK